MHKTLLISLFLLLCVPVSSKTNYKDGFIFKTIKWYNSNFNTYDTAYVKRLPYKFEVRLQNKEWIDMYKMSIYSPITDKREEIGLTSDMQYKVGLSISAFGLSIGYSVKVNEKLSGRVFRGMEWYYNYSASRINFRVLYLQNDDEMRIYRFGALGADGSNKLNIPFNGLTARKLNVELNYFFNGTRYSHAVAYKRHFREQRISAGSFIGGVKCVINNLNFDFNGLPENMISSLFSNVSPIYKFHYWDLCANIGYAHNFVLKRWLLNGSIFNAVGMREVKYDSGGYNYQLAINPSMAISAIYTWEKYFAGADVQYDLSVKMGGKQLTSSNLHANLYLGLNF